MRPRSRLRGVPVRQIITLGGGGFSMEPENRLLDGSSSRSRARAPRPRVCFVPTASGDADEYVGLFHRAFADARLPGGGPAPLPTHDSDLRAFVLAQDVIYVGGGNTANLLAVWRVHGLDRLREAWEQGMVLCGVSAGMNCWFEQSVTDSFDPARLAALHDGLGLLEGSSCPHYDGEAQRRPVFQRLIGTGELADGWAADDGAALVFADGSEPEVVSSRPTACAYRVRRTVDGVA